MSKISCNTIMDILPLYVDDVVSEDTHNMVAEHLGHCVECRKRYEGMIGEVAIPFESSVKTLKHFKKAWKKKKLMIAAASVLATLIVLFAGYIVYDNVDVAHNFFSPVEMVTLRGGDATGEWQRVEAGEAGYLVFDSIFYAKEVILDGNCDAEVSFRISNEQGDVIVDNLTLQPGTGAPLDQLKRNTSYIVEIRTSSKNMVVIRFI